MKKWHLLFILILLMVCAAGCKENDETDVDKEQLIEITDTDTGDVLRQITDLAIIKEYTEKSEPEDWVISDSIPKDAEELYIFTSYAKVSDKAYLIDGKTWISEYQDILYHSNDGFYIRGIELNDSSSSTNVSKIPDEAGEYLLSLTDGNWEIEDKNNIFASWEVDDSSLDVIAKDSAECDFEETIEDNTESHDVNGVKTQKIEKVLLDGSVLSLTMDLEKITEFYNNLNENQWKEIEKIPEGSEEICLVVFYQNERKKLKKDTVENHRYILYEKDNQYYVSNVISGNANNKDMVICNEIPLEVGKYIEDWE